MPGKLKPAKNQGRAGRFVALLVFAVCAGGLGYIHRDDLFPRPSQETTAGLNPEFVACRTERTGHVTKMLEEGVIDQVKHDQFAERAISYCAAQFPPGGNGGQNPPVQ